MELYVAATAEFRNNLDCFTFQMKRAGLLTDGFSAPAGIKLRLKQKAEREGQGFTVRVLQTVRYLQTLLCRTW
jgi:hypothetical protein